MKCETLHSGENKKNISKCGMRDLAEKVLYLAIWTIYGAE